MIVIITIIIIRVKIGNFVIVILMVYYDITDHLFGIVVSTSDCHPRGPGFDSRLYPRNFSGSIRSGTGSIQPSENNWVATLYKKQLNPVKKTEG